MPSQSRKSKGGMEKSQTIPDSRGVASCGLDPGGNTRMSPEFIRSGQVMAPMFPYATDRQLVRLAGGGVDLDEIDEAANGRVPEAVVRLVEMRLGALGRIRPTKRTSARCARSCCSFMAKMKSAPELPSANSACLPPDKRHRRRQLVWDTEVQIIRAL